MSSLDALLVNGIKDEFNGNLPPEVFLTLDSMSGVNNNVIQEEMVRSMGVFDYGPSPA